MTSNLNQFLETHELPGIVLFAKVWGSHSHNCAKETSDYDYLAVYKAPNKAILSLWPPPDTVDGKKPDFESHEVKKFCDLLIKGNPGIVECLFTERDYVSTPEWDKLKAEKQRFLSQQTLTQYLGYAQGQLDRLKAHTRLHSKGGEYNEKWAYHAVRLMFNARRITHGEGPLVWIPEGDERDLLMDIRNGKVSADSVVDMIADFIAEVESAKPWNLPKKSDEPWLNDWLLKVRGI